MLTSDVACARLPLRSRRASATFECVLLAGSSLLPYKLQCNRSGLGLPMQLQVRAVYHGRPVARVILYSIVYTVTELCTVPVLQLFVPSTSSQPVSVKRATRGRDRGNYTNYQTSQTCKFDPSRLAAGRELQFTLLSNTRPELTTILDYCTAVTTVKVVSGASHPDLGRRPV